MKTPGDRMMWLGALALGAALATTAALGSCTRTEHLRPDHGVQSREFFDRQARAAGSGEAEGLDSEEAALINESYHESMGRRARQRRDDQGSRMLILEGDRATTKRQ